MRTYSFMTLILLVLFIAGCGGGGGGDPIIPPPPDKKADWTFMVYMGGDNNLAPVALIDINELEQVGSTDKVHFTVLADVYSENSGPYGETATTIRDDSGKPVVPMMHITKHPEEGVQSHLVDAAAVMYPSQGFNSADPNNLKSFIKWSAQRFPAKNYALVIWDHGSSWLPGRVGSAAISDWDEGDGDSMYIHEIEAAIKGAGVHFGLLAFVACNMGGVEIAYQLKDVTDYICGSQKTMLAGSDDNFKIIANSLTGNSIMTPESLGKVLVDSYMNSWSQSNEYSVTSCVIKTDKLPAVAQAVNQLVPLLSNPAIISSEELRNSFFEPVRFFQDADLCNYSYVLPYHAQNPTLNTALNFLRDKVHEAVVYNRTFTSTNQEPLWSFGTRDFGNGEDLNVVGAEGLNIYLPTSRDWTQENFGYYNSIAFNQVTGWSFVIAHAYQDIPYLGTVPGNWMAMLAWSTNVDLDLWVFEPDGYGGLVPASPWLGSQSTNAYLSPDSYDTGESFEGYLTKPEIIEGPYFFLAVYSMPSYFPPQNEAWCILAIGDSADFENGNPLTTNEYYISATQPNDPDFGQGVVYFGYAIYNPDDGNWYFAEGDRGGESVKEDTRTQIGAKMRDMRSSIEKTHPQSTILDENQMKMFHEQGIALADKLRQKLNKN